MTPCAFDRSGAPVLETKKQRIVCDPVTIVPAGTTVFVSHSHADHHPQRIANPIIASEETVGFLKAKLGNKFAGKAIYSAEGAELTDTNHILGSRGLYLEDTLYTGDYCMTARGIHKKEPVFRKCKTLITDATYAMHGFRFPDFRKIVEKTRGWIRAMLEKGKTVFLTCSSATGKPQEIMHLVKGMEHPVYASPFTSSRVYREYGTDLGEFQEAKYIRALPSGPKVVIVHPSRKYGIITEDNCMDSCLGNVTGIGYFNDFVKRRCTGLEPEEALQETYASLFSSRIREEKDAIHIPISDHSDYPGLLKLLKQTRPEEVYFPRSHFRVPAECLGQISEETGIRAEVI